MKHTSRVASEADWGKGRDTAAVRWASWPAVAFY